MTQYCEVEFKKDIFIISQEKIMFDSDVEDITDYLDILNLMKNASQKNRKIILGYVNDRIVWLLSQIFLNIIKGVIKVDDIESIEPYKDIIRRLSRKHSVSMPMRRRLIQKNSKLVGKILRLFFKALDD